MADSRGISLTTPLGPDALFLKSFRGREGLSQLYQFQLDLFADNRKNVEFDKVLGQPVAFALSLPDGKTSRHFNGICNSLVQVSRDATFTSYRMEVVPHLWLLSRRMQSRIFQQISVPDILRKVLAGLNVKFELQGTFEPRDYCVQYRESDFSFASRLMEEEGIYYYFKHGDGECPMIVGNSMQTHVPVLFSETAIYEELEGGNRPDMRVSRWEKHQEVRSGKVTLWDHCFELPRQHLDAERPTLETVKVGKETHKLKLPANDALELYDYPGGYAGRFDGVGRGGGDQAATLQKIFQDGKRTAAIRMDQEALKAILIHGASNCRQFSAGHKFALERHFNADGPYVLTSVEHSASLSAAASGREGDVVYNNHFTCVPLALPFRPPQATPRPKVAGLQTAVVVGPPGEEIYTDKYSRVKVQFPWDREGKYDDNSSCWIRVATIWAGKGYGVIHIPRIGQEVVVDFMEGDPDQPIIIGSVYNAENMPAAELPGNKMVSGLKSANYPGGGGYNGMVCNDTKGKQMVTVHAQYDMSTTVEHDDTQHVINNRTITVDGTKTETIKKETKIAITEGPYSHSVAANTAAYYVKGAVSQKYDDTVTVEVKAAVKETYNATQATTVKNKITIASTDDEIEINGKTQIKLICGASSIVLKSDGTIQISGKEVTISGTAKAALGVGNQSVTCDPAQVAVAGAAIASSATGKHEITGAVVKIN